MEQRSFTISFLGKRPAFDGGAGTQEDPFQISTLEQLNAIRLKLGGHYILTADIDLAQWGLVWIPKHGLPRRRDSHAVLFQRGYRRGSRRKFACRCSL